MTSGPKLKLFGPPISLCITKMAVLVEALNKVLPPSPRHLVMFPNNNHLHKEHSDGALHISNEQDTNKMQLNVFFRF